MRLSSHSQRNVTVITFDGSLDSDTAPSVRTDLERLIPGTGTTVLDLEKLTYLSSAGLRALLLVHRRAQQNRARVVLSKLSPDVREVMNATGFLNFFEVVDSDDAEVLT